MPKITHNIYDTKEGFSHSISVDGVEGPRVGYTFIAMNSDYRAGISDYWGKDMFPTDIVRITSVDFEVNKAS